MKKRAKQLAMLGLTVTMMCGTQMTAFASGLGEEAPVALETDADTDTVTTPAQQADVEADVEANADTNIEAEADEVKDVQGELTGIDFTTAEGGVVTVTDADFNSGVVAIPYVLHGTPYDGELDNGVYFDVISSGDFGIDNPQDLDGNGNYEGAFYAHKDALVAEGGTKTYSGTFKMMDTEAGGVDDTLDFSVTVKYVADGTVTPDPEKDGWIKTEEGWKYYENGQKATGWKAVSENWYYFNEDGIMATGWVSVGGHWYYLNSSGAMETGWTSVGSHWYYLNADGTMATGWVSIVGHWYYLNADGSMATGWVSIGGHWYYLNADGSMATGWASVGGHWYYLNTDGSMATGWVSVGGHWYYLNTDGSMASSQWIDGWYVDASGKML